MLSPIPTKLYLHLSIASYGIDWTILTRDLRDKDGKSTMENYPFICEIDPIYAPGVTTESVEAQLPALRLGLLYKQAGEAQAKLDAIKEEIQKLLCIGHDAPIQAPPPEPGFGAFDDDIPF